MFLSNAQFQKQQSLFYMSPPLSPPHSNDSSPTLCSGSLFERGVNHLASTGMGPAGTSLPLAFQLPLPLHVLYSPPHELNSQNSLALLAAAATSGSGGPGCTEPQQQQPPLALFCSASQSQSADALHTLQSPFAYSVNANSAVSRVLFSQQQQSVNEQQTGALFCEGIYCGGEGASMSSSCSSNPQSQCSGSSSSGCSMPPMSCTLTPPKSIDERERLEPFSLDAYHTRLALQFHLQPPPPPLQEVSSPECPNPTLRTTRGRPSACNLKPNPCGVRRNGVHARRHAANMRERKRMHSINKGFDCMRPLFETLFSICSHSQYL